MPKRTTDFREGFLADLADPQEAANYLNAALEDSEQMALVALRGVAEARQMARVAGEAGVAREALYRMLRDTGNPTYSNFVRILGALGLRISFSPTSRANDSGERPVASQAEFTGPFGSSISGLAGASESIVQMAPVGAGIYGVLGEVSRKPPDLARWAQLGLAAAGNLAGGVTIGH
ncbi:MAG: addiction module antidote protein [Bryobacteraceae bacterium]